MPQSGFVGVPRPTHQWLQPVLDYIDLLGSVVTPSGASGIPNGQTVGAKTPITQVGNATGVVGFFGNTGLPPISTGGIGFGATFLGPSGFGATGVGNSGLAAFMGRAAFNGATGTPYTIDDLVLQLKNLGILPL